jgi:hypothetical protein
MIQRHRETSIKAMPEEVKKGFHPNHQAFEARARQSSGVRACSSGLRAFGASDDIRGIFPHAGHEKI